LEREVNVKPITLRRWISGESQPRDENIRRLVRALAPDLTVLFLRLIKIDFPAFVPEKVLPGALVTEIPTEFYTRLFQIYTKTPTALVSQDLHAVLLERAIEHLDPDRLGLCLSFVICVPPLIGEQVRSLRQIGGMGTPPWKRDLGRKTIFLGMESLAGNAVMASTMIYVKSRDADPPCPVQWTEDENSAVAMPILRQGRIAGALLASSTQPCYFTPTHRGLLELYAQLTVLLFPPSDFYAPREVQLGRLPDYEAQKPYFTHFEQRVHSKQRESMASGGYLSIQQAHQNVWCEIADELLRLADSA